ncbi:phosphoribosylaminoimidazole-succinocarboxamidesynthase [Striga asiatica]|uniref:Phosphoribosylaminoimidazole-succinocarboxamidesynthase n=1 Tax=Striga asiatica TaxID=4170 RepID=A0A5A7R7G4_STRAF|nr:phosphoribosylaminoimidazole-succinocarboxamidesynthase [Striga asiatica]
MVKRRLYDDDDGGGGSGSHQTAPSYGCFDGKNGDGGGAGDIKAGAMPLIRYNCCISHSETSKLPSPVTDPATRIQIGFHNKLRGKKNPLCLLQIVNHTKSTVISGVVHGFLLNLRTQKAV